MNTDELRYFIEAAKEQDLSKAARTLGCSQSTLSHAIRRLEREFDCKLFSRSGKNVRLTVQGRKFSERAVDIVENLHDLKDEVSSGSRPLTGHLKIGGTLGVPSQILARALMPLGAAAKSTLEIVSLRSADILEKVAEKELDFGFCIDPQPYPGVTIRAIAQSDCLVAVRTDHPLFKVRKNERTETLAVYPWARAGHLPGMSSCTTHPLFAKFWKPIKARYFFNSYDVALEIIGASDAWALLPKAIIAAHAETIRPVLTDLSEPIGLALVWNEDADAKLREPLVAALTNAARAQGWRAL